MTSTIAAPRTGPSPVASAPSKFSRIESGPREPARSEPGLGESVRNEAAQVETSLLELARAGAQRVEPARPDAPQPPATATPRQAALRRTLVLWCPDWPAVAALQQEGRPGSAPAVVLSAGRVQVTTAAARAEGIRSGMRRRDAQSRHPGVVVLRADADRDARMFEPVAAAVEALVPGIEVLRPGLLACRVRGPARYFGSEIAAAERLVDIVEALDVECRIGIADGLSVAVLAARRSAIVSPGDDAAFCAGLPIGELARDPAIAPPAWAELAGLLLRLGITTAGDLAALPADKVMARFGADGLVMHRLASGLADREVSRRRIDADLAVRQHCDPPLERVDTAAFVARSLAERFHERLAAAGLACTRLNISVTTEHGEVLSRTWRCVQPLTAAATADRLRWQLDGWLTGLSRRVRQTRQGSLDRGGIDQGGLIQGSLDRYSIDQGGETWQMRRGRQDDQAHRGSRVRRDGSTRWRPPALRGSHREVDTPPDVQGGAIVELRLDAIETVDSGRIQYGLWGLDGVGEHRARSAFARVQGLLGPEAVLSAAISGGRGPADRIALAAWGEEISAGRDPALPWPGALPTPSPARAAAGSSADPPAGPLAGSPAQPSGSSAASARSSPPPTASPPTSSPPMSARSPIQPSARPLIHPSTRSPVRAKTVPGQREAPGEIPVYDGVGRRVAVTDRGMLTEPPASVENRRVVSWAGPWLLDERWWSGPVAAPPRRLARMQVLTESGPPLLLEFGARGWQIEAVYD